MAGELGGKREVDGTVGLVGPLPRGTIGSDVDHQLNQSLVHRRLAGAFSSMKRTPELGGGRPAAGAPAGGGEPRTGVVEPGSEEMLEIYGRTREQNARQEAREQGRLEGQIDVIENVLRAGAPWSLIESATRRRPLPGPRVRRALRGHARRAAEPDQSSLLPPVMRGRSWERDSGLSHSSGPSVSSGSTTSIPFSRSS